MNDKFTNNPNPEDESIARKLNLVAERTNASGQFAADLEEKLRNAHPPRTGWLSAHFGRISPLLGWVVVMAVLALVLSWSIKSLIPSPQPVSDVTPVVTTTPPPTLEGAIAETATPPANMEGYDFRGAQLYLLQPLPDSPARAHVFLRQDDEPATQESARAFADRFGVQGEMYTAPGLVYGTTDYVVSDGKQFLQMHSDRYFMYTADIVSNNRLSTGIPSENAEATIREFLTARGFDFNFRVSDSNPIGTYIVQPLAPDSIPMQYESFTQPVMRVMLDENGQVLTVNASLIDYDPAAVGEYGIITADEALRILLDDTIFAGKMEFSHSIGFLPQVWYRNFPNDQTVPVHGFVTSNPSVDPGKPALVLIDGVPAVGNTAGMEKLEYYTFVKAVGRYIQEREVRKFEVDSWSPDVEPVYVTGTLHRDGDQVILTLDDGSGNQYPLMDPPENLPLDTDSAVSQLALDGVFTDEKMDWKTISYYADASQFGGGGGGGGMGFYQLNLSGTPVPFPTPAAQSGSGTVPTEYIVKEGDTLASIGSVFGISLEDLAQANGLNDQMVISVGQRLVIPSPEAPDLSLVIGKRYESLRGLFILNIYREQDGTERKEYAFVNASDSGSNYWILEGEGLEALENYHNLPVDIWATIESANQFGQLTARVERFEVPYPDLTFQVIRGTQQVQEINGAQLLTFREENGTTYIQRDIVGDVQTERSMVGEEGDQMLIEALIIPDEPFAGYPTLRAFATNFAVDPTTGEANEMTVTADQPFMMDAGISPDNYIRPNLSIDKVELVYFVNNPYYQVNDPNYDQRSPYIQPAWHFHGFYDNRSEFDVLIQALDPQFLLPELVPGLTPG